MDRIKIMFRHMSIQGIAVSWIIGMCILLISAPWWVWLFVPLGIAFQYLNEYSLHRFIFHLPPPQAQWKFNLLYQAHYGHHDFPTNEELFFAPVWVVLPLLVVNTLITYLIASLFTAQYALPIAAALVMVGGATTFMCYEWFHMTAHLPVKKTWVERHVTTLHNQHHFRDFSKWFHVSPGGEIIDRAMGTDIDREALKQQQRVEFIRTLNMRPDDPRLVSARNTYAVKYDLASDEIAKAAKV